MANTKISNLTALAAVPADDDQFVVVDTSATSTKKIAASFLAFVGRANAFTAAQTITSPAAGTTGLIVDTAASPTAAPMIVRHNGSNVVHFCLNGDRSTPFYAVAFDNGTSNGPQLILDRNSNASTPAAGNIVLMDKGGAYYFIWPDDTGVLRIHTASPTNANDTAGTVVGAQTSYRAAKEILGAGVAPAEALRTLLSAPVHRFRYKSGSYNETEFHGITTDDSPEFGMDEGRAFNPVSAFGYLVQGLKELNRRLETVEVAHG